MAKARTKRIATNDQILRDIMNNSKYGALAHAFVIDALTKFADMVAESDPEKDYPENCWVHPQSWVGVAKEVKEKLDAAYKR